jgi:hypothetical protein
MLALADGGACIVGVVNDAVPSTVDQCRRAGRVVAEASTLGILAEMLEHPVRRG